MSKTLKYPHSPHLKRDSAPSILTGLFLSILLFFPSVLEAQSFTWTRDFAGLTISSAPELGFADESEDGSIYAAGKDWAFNFLVRFSADGNTLFSDSIPGFSSLKIQGVRSGKTNQVVVVGSNGPNAGGTILVTDSSLTTISAIPFGSGTVNFTGLEKASEKSYLGFGTQTINGASQAFVFKLDSNVTFQWVSGPPGANQIPTSVCENPFIGYYWVAHRANNNNTFDPTFSLSLLDPNGSPLTSNLLPSHFASVNSMLATDTVELLITGGQDTIGQTQGCPPGFIKERALLANIDFLGNVLSESKIETINPGPIDKIHAQGMRLYKTPQGAILWSGLKVKTRIRIQNPVFPFLFNVFVHSQAFVGRIDSLTGINFVFPTIDGVFSNSYITQFNFTRSGDLLNMWRSAGGVDGYNGLHRTGPFNPAGNWGAANLQLHFVLDADSNCQVDSILPMPEFQVQLNPNIYPVNLSTNQYSFFELPLDTYQISLNSTYTPYWEQTCPSVPPFLEVVTYDSLISRNIGVAPRVSCPLMKVDLGSFVFRPCSNSSYAVHCSNQGTTTADSAFVEIELDPLLTAISASVPWELPQVGNQYRFHLGAMVPGQDTNITFNTLVNCNATIGQAICSNVHIYPDSFCTPDTTWNGASLVATAKCNAMGDSVIFQVRNVGNGNMTSGGNIMVLEDNVLRQQFPVNLNSGLDTTFLEAATGGTWYIRADQPLGHPGSTFSADVLEACGTDSMGNFTTGFVSQIALSDWIYFQDSDCETVSAAFDPNDKRGFPLGIGPQHLIDSTTLVTYKIRFQNTGTDTAFNILITDTLPPEMDPGSFSSGSSSHPYAVSFQPGRLVQFHFQDIALPDSNVDESASHGFIQFTLNQMPGNQRGTVILNDADIFFDYNLPVKTNEYFHTIDSIVTGTLLWTSDRLTSKLQAGPNPFHDQIRFFRSEGLHDPAEFSIYNITGQRVHHQQVKQNKWTIHAATLPSGIYIFKYSELNGHIESGRIIKY